VNTAIGNLLGKRGIHQLLPLHRALALKDLADGRDVVTVAFTLNPDIAVL